MTNSPYYSVPTPSGGNHELIPYHEKPTVKPVLPYDPTDDVQVLRKAMKGIGTDEDALVSVLSKRTSAQRQEIIQKYQQSYARDLLEDLHKELSGKFEKVMLALMTPLPLYLARECHDAMKGIGTTEKTLVEILCTCNNEWILAIKEAYFKEYDKKIEDAIKKDTSGDFKRIMISMCAGFRDEKEDEDFSKAKDLARQLFAAGEGTFGTNEEEINRILATYSFPMLRCVFADYRNLRGEDFGSVISKELSGDMKTGMKAIYRTIENRAGYFARRMHEAMSGAGTDDKVLMRIVVSRAEIDMGNIKDIYQDIYGKPLQEAIKGETSGFYKKILLGMTYA